MGMGLSCSEGPFLSTVATETYAICTVRQLQIFSLASYRVITLGKLRQQ